MRRIDLDKLILEAYQEVLSEQVISENKGTILLKDLPKETVDSIKRTYDILKKKKVTKGKDALGKKPELPSKLNLETDYVSSDLSRLYVMSAFNPETGAESFELFELPSMNSLYVDLKATLEGFKELTKQLSKSGELSQDEKFKGILKQVKSLHTSYQSYLRDDKPHVHALLKQQGHIAGALEEVRNYVNKHLSSLNEALSEEDYHRLIELIISANSHLPVYYSPSWNVVNIGGTGYDKGDLVKHFNAKPGTSSSIKNLFYHAAQTPEETKEAVERLSNGKVSVELDRSLVKYKLNSLNESLWKEISEAEEEPTPEEEPDMTAPEETVLEDATDTMLGKFPTLKAALTKLHTEDFKEFVDSIDWISPRPSGFRINLKNGQDYELKWMGKSFQANILGKRFFLNKIDEYQQALDKLNVLYKEAPFASADEEAELADVDTDTGGGGGGGGDFPGSEPTGGGGEEDLGGGEEGGADLTGEPVDFEAPAEEPEA